MATQCVRTSKTIIASCSNATTLLRIMLLAPLDTMCYMWQEVRVNVMVDDIIL